MSSDRTAWHVFFGRLLEERAAPGIEVRSEVPLGSEPQRSDFLLLRRQGQRHEGDDLAATVLHGLWPHLATETLMEFKSVTRPFARRDLERLLGYGLQWWVAGPERLPTHADLTLALVVAARTQMLVHASPLLGLRWRQLAEGYHALEGAPFAWVVVELDAVATAEHDSLVGTFGHGSWSPEARRWWSVQQGTKKVDGMRVEELEGYEEIERRLLEGFTPEQRVKGLTPEQRLSGLAAEQWLAGLPPEQQILALSDDVLGVLPDTFIDTLPASVRARIRERLKR